jgi:hypothetical protein
MGTTLKTTRQMAQKKEKSRIRLAERYYGKRDLLAAWEERPRKADPGYLRDLRRRVRGHQMDLAYRGADEFIDTNIEP